MISDVMLLLIVSVLDKVTCCASLSEYLAAERRSGASVRLHAGKQRDLSVNKRNIFITLIFTGCFSDFRSVFTSAPCRSVLPLRAAALCRCSGGGWSRNTRSDFSAARRRVAAGRFACSSGSSSTCELQQTSVCFLFCPKRLRSAP